MSFLILLFVLTFVSTSAAEDLSLVQPPQIVKEIAPPNTVENTIDPEFEEMKSFIRLEHERMRALKILNLDLERANLELKKREIELKLSDLNKGMVTPAMGLSSGHETSELVLAGVFINKSKKAALFKLDGRMVHVPQGSLINEQMTLKEVKENSVVLEQADGGLQTIQLGS